MAKDKIRARRMGKKHRQESKTLAVLKFLICLGGDKSMRVIIVDL